MLRSHFSSNFINPTVFVLFLLYLFVRHELETGKQINERISGQNCMRKDGLLRGHRFPDETVLRWEAAQDSGKSVQVRFNGVAVT